jgi:hypothetical protein
VVRRFEHLRHLERWRAQGVGIAFDEIPHGARDAIALYVAGWLEPDSDLEEIRSGQFTPADDSPTS